MAYLCAILVSIPSCAILLYILMSFLSNVMVEGEILHTAKYYGRGCKHNTMVEGANLHYPPTSKSKSQKTHPK